MFNEIIKLSMTLVEVSNNVIKANILNPSHNMELNQNIAILQQKIKDYNS